MRGDDDWEVCGVRLRVILIRGDWGVILTYGKSHCIQHFNVSALHVSVPTVINLVDAFADSIQS